MQYMLLIYDDEGVWRSMPEEERNTVMGEYGAYTEALKSSGRYVAGDALQPTATAKSLRVRDGGIATTDGPFAETKEALGGYYLIDAPDLDTALAVGKLCPARFGGVEVRPVMTFD
jgi:hypothetical protein